MTVEDHADVRGLIGELLTGLQEISEVRHAPQGVSGLKEDRRFRAACAAMQGLLACGAARPVERLENPVPVETLGQWVANEAVGYADELLKRLGEES